VDEREARFAALYERYYRNVFGYVLLRVGHEAAEDVTGDVFIIAWRKFDEVPHQPLPWLLGVARNLARQSHDAREQARSLVNRLAVLTTEADRRAWDAADHVVAREEALSALRVLSDKEAEAITLVAWHGLTPAQAARVVGCSRTTFLVRLHRGRRRLAEVLDAPHEPSSELPTLSSRFVPEQS
jgi:RNA polymerase sigma factor (sigma-70 family)